VNDGSAATASPQWLGRATGAALLREEVRQVADALDSVFGDELVQLGQWGDAGLFRPHARTRRQTVVGTRPGPGVDIVCELDDLCIGGDCVDVVLLPHTLETAADPHAVLREVDRILRPDGHVVIVGFNPLGWWGARHYLTRRTFPDGLQRMVAEYRLRDWLQLLSFRVQRADYYFFAPPLYRPGPWCEPAAAQASPPAGLRGMVTRFAHWQGFAACYLLVARKEMFSMTPMRVERRRQARLVAGLVNPTTRNAA
jgi:SAM-dependent methyltransferase